MNDLCCVCQALPKNSVLTGLHPALAWGSGYEHLSMPRNNITNRLLLVPPRRCTPRARLPPEWGTVGDLPVRRCCIAVEHLMKNVLRFLLCPVTS